ncbi:Conserved hypothetical protein [Pseudomonas brassicacearum subsp. brassicacearum NFM421]|uniref:Uncharacterized protein n=1 Tax=Pseudomonas brassicacearum (strain NFM421) TaxID=994484 RepID=F2KFX8_PSEBN|nr:Conserved hypothetical protein [Pseudomonas brassicacearum subsp. brassicacearum NFM421]
MRPSGLASGYVTCLRKPSIVPTLLRGYDQVAGPVEDRSSRSAWECRQGRSAFRFWRVTQSVTGCIPTQSVGTIGSRGAVEIVPHAPRGNAARDAPRSASGGGRRASRDAFPRRAWERSGRGGLWRSFLTLRVGMPPGTLRVPLLEGDAERHRMHAHAERGNDQIAGAVEIVPHAPRGNAARDAPRSASGG